MVRPRIDDSAPLEVVTARVPRAQLKALDIVAFGLALKTGKVASRGDALRFLLGQVLDAVLKRGRIADAIEGLAPEARAIAWTGLKATQRIADSSTSMVDRALWVMKGLPKEVVARAPRGCKPLKKLKQLGLPGPLHNEPRKKNGRARWI